MMTVAVKSRVNGIRWHMMKLILIYGFLLLLVHFDYSANRDGCKIDIGILSHTRWHDDVNVPLFSLIAY